MRVPIATYRVQFNRDFRFENARLLAGLLQSLGFSDLYCSPIFQARRGSNHGYDVTDPSQLNPELGTAEDFEAMAVEMERHGIGLLLDIVPNHMAASPENPWWMDVLENGASSPYADYFNVEWQPVMAHGAVENKILLPVLAESYAAALESQKLKLVYEDGAFFVRYHDQQMPVDPQTYATVLAHGVEGSEAAAGLAPLAEAFARLPVRTVQEPSLIEWRQREKQTLKRRLAEIWESDAVARQSIERTLQDFNGRQGEPRSFDLLDQLISDQAYRPGLWRLATERINYWRFFDISDLVGVRTENPETFAATHALVCRLAQQGKISGLRVDHVDGLHDPLGYLHRLRGCGPAYVVVEKILLGDEELPATWPVCGTTGYDFLNTLNGLFVDLGGMDVLESIYRKFTGVEAGFRDTVYEEKKRMIGELFRGELRVLWNQLAALAEQDRYGRDLSPKELVEALVEVTACLPVYRTYVRDFAIEERDRAYIERAVEEAGRRNQGISAPVFEFLRRVLLLDPRMPMAEEVQSEWLRFVMRWQQFTGPVTAKGLEDTALYVYNRLTSLNEVGTNCRPVSAEAFHRFNAARQSRGAGSLNATSTHDAKRSEDVRARINVLSTMPDAWGWRLRRWGRWNENKRSIVNGRPVPDRNEEYFLYQTMLGAWPLDAGEEPAFRERLKQYVRKAAREAKVHTSWIRPDPQHEQALDEFVDCVLEPEPENRFLGDFLEFQRVIAYYGAMESLAQVLLKIASPGVPDFYQGTLGWNLSLVDPDNRRPVDHAWIERQLDRLNEEDPARLLRCWPDGRIKLWVTMQALRLRREHSELFAQGEYLALGATGDRQENVVALARRKGAEWCIVAAPRLVAKFCLPGRPPIGGRRWGSTALELPSDAPKVWRNALTRERLHTPLTLRDLFRHVPVALLYPGVSA